jgi:hypothetical protein
MWHAPAVTHKHHLSREELDKRVPDVLDRVLKKMMLHHPDILVRTLSPSLRLSPFILSPWPIAIHRFWLCLLLSHRMFILRAQTLGRIVERLLAADGVPRRDYRVLFTKYPDACRGFKLVQFQTPTTPPPMNFTSLSPYRGYA